MKTNSIVSIVAPAVCCLFPISIASPLAEAQQVDSNSMQSSCHIFVQQFYDWYLPNTTVKAEKANGLALDFALSKRLSAFDPELVRQLRHGEEEAKREGEPFLDFDPVLNSQDPDYHYEVREVTVKDNKCSANVYAISRWHMPEKRVIAELSHDDHGWHFQDFRYPDSEDENNKSLRRMLLFLQKHEQKQTQ